MHNRCDCRLWGGFIALARTLTTDLISMSNHAMERYSIRLPATDLSREVESDAWFYLDKPKGTEKIRFHDYATIYNEPGLYEQIFYDRLKCTSPDKLAGLLNKATSIVGDNIHGLRVLDLGAGNGMMAESLYDYGISRIVGSDIIEEARAACERDRPGLYDDYVVADFTNLDQELREGFRRWRFNCLTTVAALGYNDIPIPAFREAFNLIEDDGWIVFNIKETFLGKSDTSGFSRFIKELISGEFLHVHHIERYRHRYSIEGNPLYYHAVIGRKTAAFPENIDLQGN